MTVTEKFFTGGLCKIFRNFLLRLPVLVPNRKDRGSCKQFALNGGQNNPALMQRKYVKYMERASFHNKILFLGVRFMYLTKKSYLSLLVSYPSFFLSLFGPKRQWIREKLILIN